MRLSVLMFFVVSLVVACSTSPPSSTPRYACREDTLCPSGQVCIANLPPGEGSCCGGPPCGTQFYRAKCSAHPDCGGGNKCEQGRCIECESLDCAEFSDGGTLPIPNDLSTVMTDMRDPFAWNPGQPRGPAAGCSSGQGWVLSAKLHACPGQCNSNMCPGLCATGWSNPTTLSIPETACASVPWGFFASAAHGLDTMWLTTSSMRCDWEAPNSTWDQSLRLGCGHAGRIFNGTLGARVYTQVAPQKCGGFPVVARCTGLTGASTADTPFSCDPPGNPYREVYYGPVNLGIRTTPSDGVLCAQP
jgi:hypothetical protein